MQYQGGKYVIRKYIAAVIESLYADQTFYLEPFVGAASILRSVNLPILRVGSDIDPDIITLIRHIQKGWEPPYYAK